MGIFSKAFKKANSLGNTGSSDKKSVKKPDFMNVKLSEEMVELIKERSKIVSQRIADTNKEQKKQVEQVAEQEFVEDSVDIFLNFIISFVDNKYKVIEKNNITPAIVNDFYGKEFPGLVDLEFDGIDGYNVISTSYEWNEEKERFIFTFVTDKDDTSFVISPNRQKWQVKVEK